MVGAETADDLAAPPDAMLVEAGVAASRRRTMVPGAVSARFLGALPVSPR
jgi:hypothetical protein